MASVSAEGVTGSLIRTGTPTDDERTRVRAFFEESLAAQAQSPERNRVVPLNVRREAFSNFDGRTVSGGKPGRDWKHDYAHVAATVPWTSGGASPLGALAEPLLPRDAVLADIVMDAFVVRIHGSDGDAKGVRLRHVRDLQSEDDVILRDNSFGRAVHWRGDKFASLAAALIQDGPLIYVPPRVRAERPVLIRANSALYGSTFPYTLIVLDEGAEATVVEDTQGPGFFCGIVEAIVGDGARLNYIAVQRAGTDSTVLMNRGAVCGKDASCNWYLAELGGGLSRSLVSTRLEGRGATTDITAFFFNDGDQHVDLSSLVEHAVGDSASRTIVKSAAKERGQGRYLGNIRIDEHANGSDAALRDDALLLSKYAHIDSVPALEIASNDVKAFHGATIGSIDEEELFYAQSRGIERNDAERMIALGFFEPALSTFPIAAVRDTLRTVLSEKAGAANVMAETA